MADLTTLNLQYNPFKNITPSMEDGNVVWAEMHDIKSKLERSYTECIQTNSKQVVLNWGQYGGGKTFSAYYFIKEKGNTANLTNIYVRCPKDGGKATDEFFKSIIDYISFETIHNHIRTLIGLLGEEQLMTFLTPKTSREYAKAICLIGSDDAETKESMNRFLYAGVTKTELKKLGLAKDIQTDSDSIKFLAGIISCFIGDGNLFKGNVVFWIDEMEDLIYYSPKHYKAFSQVLRDFFDSISNSFLVFMNFTLAESEESTIELILGGAVWSRITKKIRYKQFTETNALTYVDELLVHSKIDSTIGNKPFNSALVARVIEHIPSGNLTPREINKHFNSLISYAIEKNSDIINQNILNEWIREYEEDN